ncbi:MAG: ATP synthase F1 subunit delta [Rhodobacterales bacterium]|nr:ATP synthase F1 subunit delta [Rhodobacterales bacterium]
MPEHKVARRYAEALIDVASEANAADQVGADLRGFTALLRAGEGQLRDALCTPLFSSAERGSVIEELLPKLALHKLSSNFLRLVNTKGRMAVVGDIAEVYGRLADERAGRIKVFVTTAESMTDAMAAEVQDAMSKTTGKEVILETTVDASLIGGMIAKVGGTVYDSSIRSRLTQIKQQLLHA